MCNEYEVQRDLERQYAELMQREALQNPPDWEDAWRAQAETVKVTEPGLVISLGPNQVRLAPEKWGFNRPGRPPQFWTVTDGRRFDRALRGIVPASGFFEYVGKASPKTKYRFRVPGAPVFGLAVERRRIEGEDRFSLMTTKPGPDMWPYHDREVCVLPPGAWWKWLYTDDPERELLAHQPPGGLEVELVRPGKEDPAPFLRSPPA